MIAESSGYEMPFETRRHLQEHFRIHLRSARRAPRRASGGCGSVRQFATDCTHSEGSQKENAAKLLTINTLTFAKSWQTNCPLPPDAVSLAEHENDEQEGPCGGGVARRSQRRPRLVCSHVPVSIARRSAWRPAYAARTDPAPCACAHL